MAKKKKNEAPDAPAAAPADDVIPCERLFAEGDTAAARRAADQALADGSSDEKTRERARAVLDMAKLDAGALALLGGVLAVVAVAFLNFIVVRNGELKTLPAAPDLTKSIVRPAAPPPETVPAQGPVEDNRGTP